MRKTKVEKALDVLLGKDRKEPTPAIKISK
jgi:hypothetical protein